MKSVLVGLVFILIVGMAVFIALGFTGVYDPWGDGEPTPTLTPTPTGTPGQSVGLCGQAGCRRERLRHHGQFIFAGCNRGLRRLHSILLFAQRLRGDVRKMENR